jgi:hypothetical protein
MLSDQERIHANLEAIGIRASGTAVGLFQLMKELLDAGVLEGAAVSRIKEAVITELAASRPRSQTLADYEQRVRERMDTLIPVEPDTGSAPMRH